MPDFIKNLASDLLRLEVNTIIKQNMTAEKIPANKRVLLRRLADSYREALADYEVAKLPEDGDIIPTDAGRVFRWRYGGQFSFQEISGVAKQAAESLEAQLANLPDTPEKADLSNRHKIVLRIRSQSSNIVGVFKMMYRNLKLSLEEQQKAGATVTIPNGFFDEEKEDLLDKEHYLFSQMSNQGLPRECVPFVSHWASRDWNNDLDWTDLNRAPELDLTPDSLSLLYKAYEIGTEQIVLQTVIQIEGDVTSYITPTYLGLPDQYKDIVMGIHNRSIVTSTQFWGALFSTIVNLAGRTFNEIFRRRTG
ncbi:MAG: hypothetical protein MUC97_08615 [Bernardetiaceae bacterium]|jgi:hypothetical protein|nr:hypothetical protein [Bernardetiaceae bacterium]